MKCISVCFKRIGSGCVYKLTDRPTTSDLIMLDSNILDPCFMPRCFRLDQVTPHLGHTPVTHTLTNEHVKAYSKFTIN